MASPAAVLQVLVTANTAQANAALARTQAQLQRTGAAGTTMGSRVGSGVKMLTAATAAVGAVSVVAAAKFDDAMAQIETQAGAPAGEVERLRQKVLDLAKTSEHGPQELAEGLFRVESAGFRGEKALRVLKQASDLADVGHSNLEQTTYALTAAMNSGIKGTANMRRTVGTLNAAVGQGNMRMEDLVGALSTGILPAAKTFGLRLGDVTSAISFMTRAGTPAQAAATRLRMTFSLMAAPTDAAAKALAKIGLSETALAEKMRGPQGLVGAVRMLRDHLSALSKVEQAQVLSEAFGGGRTSATIMAMVQDVEGLREIYGATQAKSREFGQAVRRDNETLASSWNQLKAQAQAYMIELGTKLQPTVKEIADVLGDPHLDASEKIARATEMLADATAKAIPQLAKLGVKMGAAVAMGFLRGFSQMNLLEKALTAAVLIRIFGGKGALMATGAAIGRWIGLGVGTGIATGAAGGGAAAGAAGAAGGGALSRIFSSKTAGANLIAQAPFGGALGGAAGGAAASYGSKALGFLKNIRWARIGALGIGLGLAEGALGEFARQTQAKSGDIFEALEAKSKHFSLFGLESGGLIDKIFGAGDSQAGELLDKVTALRDGNALITLEQRKQIENLAEQVGLTEEQRANLKGILDVESLQAQAANAHAALRGIFKPGTISGNVAEWNAKMRQAAGFTEQTMARIERAFRVSPAAGIKAMSAAFDRGVGNIRRSMRSGEISVEKGLSMIEDLLRAKLAALGVTGSAADKSVSISKAAAQGKDISRRGQQRGGMVQVPGTESGDRYVASARVESGEVLAVLNRNAAQEWMAWNDAYPRFAKGGMTARKKKIKHRERGVARARDLIGGAGGPTMPRWTGEHVPGEVAAASLNIAAEAAEAKLLKAQRAAASGPGALGGAAGNWGAVDAMARRLGNTITSGYRPGDDGWHGVSVGGGRARATDYAGGQMLQFAKKVAARFGSRLLELIHTPLGWAIKNGARVPPYAAADHYDHVHVAMQRGGWISAVKRKGQTFSSTSYGPPWGGIQGTGTTATGINLKDGPRKYLVAVDPDVIGLGSKLSIWPNPFNYQGTFGAEDTGGAIQGNRIDFYDWRGRSKQLGWGERAVKVVRGAVAGAGEAPGVGGTFAGVTKKAGKRLKKLQKKIAKKGYGLPEGIKAQIGKLQGQADIFAEYADRASQLEAAVNGQDEAGWLNDEIVTLFRLRNKLIEAEEILDGMRRQLERAIEIYHRQMERMRQAVRKAKNKKQKKALLENIDAAKKQIGVWRDGLGKIGSSREDVVSSLQEVQGKGAPMERLAALPAVGVLGGRIFDAQVRLRELGETAKATDSVSTNTDLQEQLRQAQLGKLISERQYPILRRIPEIIGAYARGGMIGRSGYALVGERGPELAEFGPGGTRIHSAQETATMTAPKVDVIVNGDIVPFDDRVGAVVEVYVDGVLRDAVSKARRRT